MKSDKRNKLQKKTVLKLAGCLKSTIISSIILVCAIIGIIFIINSDIRSFVRYAILISAEIVFITALILFIKNMGLCIKVKNDRYTTKQRILRSIDSKRIFDHNKDGKVLAFDDVRITVDEKKAKEFAVGDKITLVFINGIKYPIVITKETESVEHATCG